MTRTRWLIVAGAITLILLGGLAFEIVTTRPVRGAVADVRRAVHDRQSARPRRSRAAPGGAIAVFEALPPDAQVNPRRRGRDRRHPAEPQQELQGVARGAEHLDLHVQPHRPGVSVRLRGRRLAIRRPRRHPPCLGGDDPDGRPPRPGIAAEQSSPWPSDHGSFSRYTLLFDPATASCDPSGLQATP